MTAERETAPEFQKVLTEVRLLHVMAKHLSPEAAGAQVMPMPVPVEPPLPALITPTQSLEVFAGTAPPVINPPAVRQATPFLSLPTSNRHRPRSNRLPTSKRRPKPRPRLRPLRPLRKSAYPRRSSRASRSRGCSCQR